MFDKINVYINSKNRRKDESSSKFTVTIPENTLILNDNEYFTLNVNGFYCFNSWFNVQNNFNNHFQIHMYNDANQFVRSEDYYLTPGNPSVLDLRADLNYLLSGEVSVTYDRSRNKFRYRRIMETSYTNYKMYLVIKNSEDLLGFKRTQRNELIELPYMEDVESSYYINVLGDEAIVISATGLQLGNNNIDNFGSSDMKPTSVIFMKPIDVPSNSLLTYNNEDAGDSFQYILANRDPINQFTLTVMNQDLEQILDFNEYILNLQFVRHKKKDNDMVSVLNGILDYVREIYLMISGVLFKPPPPENIF